MTRRAVATSAAPPAAGPYSQAITTDDFVFCAGQIGTDPATGELAEGLEAQTEQVLRNLGAVLDAAGCTFADVVKTTCFLADIGDFAAFNAIYQRFMVDPPPARSTFGVAALPKGARVEVEAIAVRPRA
jgi:2-iminobutanoate/2-iminopropanoate deaminase